MEIDHFNLPDSVVMTRGMTQSESFSKRERNRNTRRGGSPLVSAYIIGYKDGRTFGMHTALDTQARADLVLVFESTMIMSNARL